MIKDKYVMRCRDKDKEIKEKGTLCIKNYVEGETAELFIYGEIVDDECDKWSNTDFCPGDLMQFISQIEGVKQCDIYVNSPGGSVFAGMAMAKILKRTTCKKIGYVDACCASIATMIILACDEIHITNMDQFMIHKPSKGYFLEMKNANELMHDISILDSIEKTMVSEYMKRTKEGVTEEDIKAYLNEEKWFTGSEACEVFEFILDEAGENNKMVACASVLSMYKNVPQTLKVLAKTEENMDNDNKSIINNKQQKNTNVVDGVIEELQKKYPNIFKEKEGGEQEEEINNNIEYIKLKNRQQMQELQAKNI